MRVDRECRQRTWGCDDRVCHVVKGRGKIMMKCYQPMHVMCMCNSKLNDTCSFIPHLFLI